MHHRLRSVVAQRWQHRLGGGARTRTQRHCREFSSTENCSEEEGDGSTSTVLVESTKLLALVESICRKAGSNEEESRVVAENLVMSNLKGHDSHGVGYLPNYIAAVNGGRLRINNHIDIISKSKTGTIINVDGGAGYGQVMGKEAMELGIAACAEHDLAVISLRNSFHLGRIGQWAEMCVAAGFVSIHFTNVHGHAPLVAPDGGTDAKLGTNPFTVGFPVHGSSPVILDFATSELALGKVREALGRGEDVPDGVLLGADGRGTRDPSVMFSTPQGAMLPAAAHKGYGIAFMVELIAGVMTGGGDITPSFPRPTDPPIILNSMTTVIINPESCSGLSHVELSARTKQVQEYMVESPLREGRDQDKIFIPGEPERQHFERRTQEGIPLSRGTYDQVLSSATSVGMSLKEARQVLR